MCASAKAIATLFAFSILVACGNAYEYLKVGQWQPAGEDKVPVPDMSDLRPEVFRASILKTGSGPEVRAGSVAHVRITGKSGAIEDPRTKAALSHGSSWLWIGEARGPVDLGSEAIRSSIVGLREGAILTFYAHPSRIGKVTMPTKALLLPYAYKPDWRQLIPAGFVELIIDFDYVELTTAGEYEMEIVRVCDGRMTRKEGTLRQWGFVFNWGDSNFKFAREGLLEWWAIDIDCGAGEEMRFEKGPAYRPPGPGGTGSQLLGWYRSYEAVRDSAR